MWAIGEIKQLSQAKGVPNGDNNYSSDVGISEDGNHTPSPLANHTQDEFPFKPSASTDTV